MKWRFSNLKHYIILKQPLIAHNYDLASNDVEKKIENSLVFHGRKRR